MYHTLVLTINYQKIGSLIYNVYRLIIDSPIKYTLSLFIALKYT